MLAKSNMFGLTNSMIRGTHTSVVSERENGSLGVSESLLMQVQTFQNFMCLSALLLDELAQSKRIIMRPIYFLRRRFMEQLINSDQGI